MSDNQLTDTFKKSSRLIKFFGFIFLAVTIFMSLAFIIPAISDPSEIVSIDSTIATYFALLFCISFFVIFIGINILNTKTKFFIIFGYLIGLFATILFPVGTLFGVPILFYLYKGK